MQHARLRTVPHVSCNTVSCTSCTLHVCFTRAMASPCLHVALIHLCGVPAYVYRYGCMDTRHQNRRAMRHWASFLAAPLAHQTQLQTRCDTHMRTSGLPCMVCAVGALGCAGSRVSLASGQLHCACSTPMQSLGVLQWPALSTALHCTVPRTHAYLARTDMAGCQT